MINVTWNATGVFALKRGQASNLVIKATSLVLQAALQEWASGRGRVRSKLSERFSTSAFGKYRFSARSERYTKRQIKVMGSARPFFSPRRVSYAKVATGIAQGNALAALRGLQDMARNAHMLTLVTRPGGFFISATNGQKTTRVKITFPGARALNKLGPEGEIYREEFRDLQRGGDIANILMRADELFTEELSGLLDRVPARRIAS